MKENMTMTTTACRYGEEPFVGVEVSSETFMLKRELIAADARRFGEQLIKAAESAELFAKGEIE